MAALCDLIYEATKAVMCANALVAVKTIKIIRPRKSRRWGRSHLERRYYEVKAHVWDKPKV